MKKTLLTNLVIVFVASIYRTCEVILETQFHLQSVAGSYFIIIML